MICRTVSGSRRSPSSVQLTTSAKTTVTVLRAPRSKEDAAASGLPQAEQNHAVSGPNLPHPPHTAMAASLRGFLGAVERNHPQGHGGRAACLVVSSAAGWRRAFARVWLGAPCHRTTTSARGATRSLTSGMVSRRAPTQAGHHTNRPARLADPATRGWTREREPSRRVGHKGYPTASREVRVATRVCRRPFDGGAAGPDLVWSRRC
jgi:hypothetical protein